MARQRLGHIVDQFEHRMQILPRWVHLGFGWGCARQADGTVHCWGYNASGQVGDGTTTDVDGPVRIAAQWP